MPKRGDLRQSDGRIFWGYHKGKEDWRNPSSYCVSVVKRRDRNKKLRDIRGRWLDLYKISKGCQICGYDEHPVALHFDHLKKADKVMDISNMKKGSLVKNSDIAFKKPGSGIPPSKVNEIVGMRLKRDVSSVELLKWDDIDVS